MSLAARATASVCQRRTARLLFDRELAGGAIDAQTLERREVRRATRLGASGPALRLLQRALYKLNHGWAQRRLTEPLVAARAAVLGAGATAPPRFLVRVDEYPHYLAWDEPERFGTPVFERFHRIMSAAGVPYLLAVLPRVSHRPLRPEALGSRPLQPPELALLGRLAEQQVAFALHGRDHRTRHPSPRRRSELCGLTHSQTETLIDQALAELEPHGIRPEVFVAPYNRFDAGQLEPFARRFKVICGGPESIGTLGLARTPQWRSDAVYLPAYAPFYGRAEQVRVAAEEAIERSSGLWLPIVLHWGWEAQDDFGELERLAQTIAPYCARWDEFLEAVARSEAAVGR